MTGDWIKLHRKLLKSAVFQDADTLKVWIWILCNANWEERQLLNGTVLRPGELLIGQDKLAKELKLTRSKIRTILSRLEKLENLTSNSTSDGTYLSVCNWETYQHRDDSKSPAKSPTPDQPLANQSPTDRQPIANASPQNKNYKKVRSKELQEEPPKSPKGDTDQNGQDQGNSKKKRRRQSAVTSTEIDVALMDLGEPAQSDSIRGWIEYRTEQHNFRFRSRGFQSFMTKFVADVAKHGETAVLEAMQTAMANGYQGYHVREPPNKNHKTAFKKVPSNNRFCD